MRVKKYYRSLHVEAGGGDEPLKMYSFHAGTLGIHHRFTRPYTPRTNGKAERFIQAALREWA